MPIDHADQPKDGDLRVWHNPQVPGPSFKVDVESAVEAKLLLGALAEYDLFQFENRVKPDYMNAGGLQAFDALDEETQGGSWIDWYDDEGRQIEDWGLGELRELAERGHSPRWEMADDPRRAVMEADHAD